MSGGSLDYVYSRVEEAIRRIPRSTPERRAFVAHLAKVAAALKAIEWVDSGDSSDEDETAPIMECISKEAVAESALDALAEEIDRATAVLAALKKETK